MGQQTEGTTAQLSSGARVDPLAVIRAHAESHRSRAESDAYSAQEAPKLEATLAAVAELVAAASMLGELYDSMGAPQGPTREKLRAALSPFSEAQS